MRARFLVLSVLTFLGGCSTLERLGGAPDTVTVQIIAFNDFHGALVPPRQAVTRTAPDGTLVKVPAGGAAYLADAIATLRADNPNSVVVAAGDLISASPIAAALFLDESSVEALDLMGVAFSAVGNHEFDRGRAELMRMANGGCEKLTAREPCALGHDFKGATYSYLSANVFTEDGKPLFPPYAIKSFGTGDDAVQVAFIGLTLKDAPAIISPAGIAGLTFTDEADAANALVPELRAQGVEAIVILIHQGAEIAKDYPGEGCDGLSGDIMPILTRLDPEIDVVVSGHTHRAYVCDFATGTPGHTVLLTSAGNNGTQVTGIALTIDPAAGQVTAKSASNTIVQSEAYTGSSGEVAPSDLYPRFAPDPAVAALVARYVSGATPLAEAPSGRLTGAATRELTPAFESALGDLVADAQLAATSAPGAGGADVAFTNPGGLRADLVPAADGSVTFGQLFAVQPFANSLVVKTMTGRQILDLLEQQFDSAAYSPTEPKVLLASSTLSYAFDITRPAGSRIFDVRIKGRRLKPDATYRVTTNQFLADGGDGFTVFKGGTEPLIGPQDLDALEAYLSGPKPVQTPVPDRIRNATP